MKLRIEINLDNAAFEDGATEVAYVLDQVIERVPDPLAPTDLFPLYDSNGNKVGTALID